MAQLPGTDLTVSDLCLGATSSAGRPTRRRPSPCWTGSSTAAGAHAGVRRHRGVLRRRAPRSEILGGWMAAPRGARPRRRRHEGLPAASKEHPLSAAEIRTAVERSLRNLQTDVIDLYYAHYDDETTPLEETLGRVRRAGAGGQGAPRRGVELLGGAADRGAGDRPTGSGSPGTSALQTHYNLMERAVFEDELRDAGGAGGDRRPALLRAGQGLPDRQVPAGGAGRLTARAGARRRTWGSGATACSPRAGRGRRRSTGSAGGRRWTLALELGRQPTSAAAANQTSGPRPGNGPAPRTRPPSPAARSTIGWNTSGGRRGRRAAAGSPAAPFASRAWSHRSSA